MLIGVLVATPAPPTSAASGCSVMGKSTVYVICVDNHRPETQKLWVINQAGNTVYGPVTVTSSHVDDDGPTKNDDTLTRNGRWAMTTLPQAVTSVGLEYYIQFAGGQGFHAYSEVGWGYDSHGCVRLKRPDAKWLYSNVGAAIRQGRKVEAHIIG